ncbi:single-stranded DNA-binding protein [Paraburkholderia bonniea]|uniref:single-stranded DNA-binding protein n=1 Tax=Paraburkholderia bonniea TaxID=2152891 RepID=UPI0012911DFE|nr:single-stranded DNA-binding protein [Paraburkholderia bonniea]WJF90901.1 single-stranded DNA-binding protein [Paraburkholderia bonniea]WJF94215.1 single-stranded DNA-binding protein [Paraburkholderia bonniea]
MIDGLIAGKVYGQPSAREGQQGRTFVTAKVRATSQNGEMLFVNVITFDPMAQTVLLALDDGDSIALAGTLTPKVWTDRHGVVRPAIDMVAHGVLSSYQVQRKRQATEWPEAKPQHSEVTFQDGELNVAATSSE